MLASAYEKDKNSPDQPPIEPEELTEERERIHRARAQNRAHPLKEMRAAIRSVAPREATEIISYRIPAFKHREILVWYAAFSDHCSLFPKARVIELFRDELKGYSTSKGTIHFPFDKPLPVALIKKLVKARVDIAARRRASEAH